ncbi:MAG: Crp/Fnr family transcriptional regulator [Deltaproteobacteria bacterium]|nr:Crp/Fnr family transcriptional regulator [Deltaproteobacteria bacterium]
MGSRSLERDLAGIKLFSGLEPDQLRALAGVAVRRGFERGETVFHEGDAGAVLYGIVSGLVRIFKTSPMGREHTLHQFGPGEAFAEVVVFSGHPYPATAEVLEDTVLVGIPREGLRRLIGQDPDLALAMLGLLSMRLVGFVVKIEQLSLKEVPARLASHYLVLAGDESRLRLDMPKNRLATYLGTIPETLSRVQAKLTDAGLVDIDGHGVEILDRQGLEDVALGLRGV